MAPAPINVPGAIVMELRSVAFTPMNEYVPTRTWPETTTCEAMWMEAPVISLAGKTHAARVGLSLLSAVGLSDLAAHDIDQYVAAAVSLATDQSRLIDMKQSMRTRMKESALMDAKEYARKIESAYRDMWSKWCRG